VNNGEREDYDQLDKLGTSERQGLPSLRYGAGWRGIKVQLRADHGAVGALIYPIRTRTATSKAMSILPARFLPAAGRAARGVR
jgi:hypothetical protein